MNCEYCHEDKECYLQVINKTTGASALFCSLQCLANSTTDALDGIVDEKPRLSSLKND